MQTLNVVQLSVRHRFTGQFYYMELLCVPVLCSPLSNQNITQTWMSHSSLRNLTLADSRDDSGESDVGILIGLDYYHRFFTGRIVRSLNGPTALESSFGWVLSGPIITRDASVEETYCSTAHTMRCSI